MSAAGASATARGGGGTSVTAAAIAEAVGGRLIGDGAVAVCVIAPLDRAGPDALSFLASARYASQFETSGAGVVLVTPDFVDHPCRVPARIVVDKPHDALLTMLPRFYIAAPRIAGVHPTALIGRGARFGAEPSIGPYAVIGDGAVLGDRVSIGAQCVVGPACTIGDDTLLHPAATLYSGAQVGKRVIVHSGARIASDGFGYVYRAGAHQKLPHVGRAILEDDVEIGANSTIDRGSIDDTVIGAGTKIDNLVHIAHNCKIGRLCLIMAQVGIAGSTIVEDGVIIAGQAGLGGHIVVGAGAKLGGQAGVFGNVPAGESWSGYPARPHREALRAQAALFKLSGMMKRLARLLDSEGTE